MRRLFILLAAFGLLAGAVGCCHTCGVCDCSTYTPCAGGCCGGAPPAAPHD